MRRLETKLGVELLWPQILSILKKKPTHAYAIRKRIEERFGFLPGNVTAYVVLYKLESHGFVKARSEGNRRVYSITESGKRLLEEGKKALKEKEKKLFG
jgi:DNA-binding PadR family transcriptional regulator